MLSYQTHWYFTKIFSQLFQIMLITNWQGKLMCINNCDYHSGLHFLTNSVGKIPIIGLYRSPNLCIASFFKALNYCWITLLPKKHHFVIIGDINIDTLNSCGPLTLRMRDFLSSFNWKLSINLPSRVTATASTAMDNVI